MILGYISLPVGVGAAGRVGLEPAGDRGGTIDESLNTVAEVGTADEVCAQEVSHLGIGGVLGGGSVGVDGRDDKPVVVIDVAFHCKCRRADGICCGGSISARHAGESAIWSTNQRGEAADQHGR